MSQYLVKTYICSEPISDWDTSECDLVGPVGGNLSEYEIKLWDRQDVTPGIVWTGKPSCSQMKVSGFSYSDRGRHVLRPNIERMMIIGMKSHRQNQTK